MKIAVFGCGAMGSIYAGLLADTGHEVIAIDRHEAHVKAINTNGLRVSGASGDRCVPIRAFTRVPDEKIDLLIIALKAAHVQAAAEARHMLSPGSSVLTIQNGLGSADIVAEALGQAPLLVGVAQGFGASLPAPGHSHHNDMKAIRIGRFQSDGTADLQGTVDVFQQAGFDTGSTDDIRVIQWEKLICNVAYSGPCALTGMTVGDVLDDEFVGPVSRAAAKEAWDTARRLGIPISVEDPDAYVRDFAERMRDARPSVLLDIEAGRRSEIEVINGAVPVQAARVNAAAPVNRTITALVRSLEERMLKQEN